MQCAAAVLRKIKKHNNNQYENAYNSHGGSSFGPLFSALQVLSVLCP